MNDSLGETLSRLIDGDDVDLSLLAQAIELEEGRRLLMDFASLRQSVRADDGTLRTSLSPVLGKPPGVFRASPMWQRSVAAAIALMAVGVLLFGLDRWRGSGADAPPRVERVLRFEPSEWTFANGR